MKTLKCGCGKDILLDEEDFELLKDITWYHGNGTVFM